MPRALPNPLKAMLMLGRGRSTRVDDAGPVQRHQIEGLDGELLDEVERMTDYGFASHPMPGAEGLLAAIGGLRGQSVVLAVGDRRYRFPLDEGEVALFDDQGQSIHLARDGVRIVSPFKVTVETPTVEVTADSVTVVAPAIDLTGDLTLTGDLKVTGDTVLDGAVALGGEGGLKPVARHDDVVTAGKVVATATRTSAK